MSHGWRCALVAVMFAASTGSTEQHGAAALALGDRLPSVTLTGLEGELPIQIGAMRGALVINFWATWCAPCRSEMPALERLSRRAGEHGVHVIGITVDRDLNLARELVRSTGLTFPMYAEVGQPSVQSALGVSTLPYTLLIDRDGMIAARIIGARDWDSAETDALLQRVLGGRFIAAQ